MVSQLAIDDINDIISSGGMVAPEDVIMLNALALDITHSGNCELATLPRIASLCNIYFREPSVKQDIFLDDCARIFADDASTYLLVQIWVLGQNNNDLDDELLKRPDKLAKKIQKWVKENLADTTLNQIERIVSYCRYGCDQTTGEYPIYLIDDELKEEKIHGDRSWALQSYLHSVTLGINSESALKATSKQLTEMIERAYLVRGLPLSADEKRATAIYYKTLDIIKQKALKDNENEQSENQN